MHRTKKDPCMGDLCGQEAAEWLPGKGQMGNHREHSAALLQ